MSNRKESFDPVFAGASFPPFLLSGALPPPFFWILAFIPFINFLVCGDNDVERRD